MHMLYKHKDALSLRDEIGAFTNIELKIDIVDNLYILLDLIM